jgi:site-specific recombinase XerD
MNIFFIGSSLTTAFALLQDIISDFLIYCKTYNFGTRSLNVFSSILNKFAAFLDTHHIYSIKEISYTHLLSFIIDNNPSVHTKKQRVWTLHQYFHFLKLKKIIETNIAMKLPYPKIDKKEPDFLSVQELKTIINYFVSSAVSDIGIRNLIIVLFLIFLGLRVSTLININIQDINLKNSTVIIRDKGERTRIMPLPQVLCFFLYSYLQKLDTDLGPLFFSARNKRISNRMIQHIISKGSRDLGIHIHSHIFRHTAATQLNKIAGLEVAKEALGHRRTESTKRYVHLNPDIYAEYMRRHPYMQFGKENLNE